MKQNLFARFTVKQFCFLCGGQEHLKAFLQGQRVDRMSDTHNTKQPFERETAVDVFNVLNQRILQMHGGRTSQSHQKANEKSSFNLTYSFS